MIKNQNYFIPSIDYLQQTAPSSPSYGQIWRQINSSNLPIQDLYWNGTYWLTQQNYVISTNTGLSISATTTLAIKAVMEANRKILIVDSSHSFLITTNNYDSSNYYTFQPFFEAARYDNDYNVTCPGIATINSFSARKNLVVNLDWGVATDLTTATKGYLNTFRAFFTKVGSPNTLTWDKDIIRYKLIY